MSLTLVTGGAGFIGRHVVRALLETGRSVRVLLAPGEPAELLGDLPVQRAVADLRDLPGLDAAVSGCTEVVHLAALYSMWMRDWQALYEVNVQGSANVLRAAADAGVGRVLLTSSIGALGVPPGTTPATEDTPFDQFGRCPHYILSKHYAHLVGRAAQAAGQDVVIVYPAMPFGPGDHRPTPTGKSLLRVLGGAYFAVGPGGINAVDVRDVARGHVLALEGGAPGGRYLLSGHDLAMEDYFRLVHRLGGVHRRLLRVSGRELAVLGAVGDLVGQIAEPLIDTRTVRYTSQHLTYDCGRAERELGYVRRPLEETFTDAIRWFRERGYPEPGVGLWDLTTRKRMTRASAREGSAER